jgi:hypothetical protein
MTAPIYPFAATEQELRANLDQYVDSFIGSLCTFFLTMPKGSDFIEFARFQAAYETLKGDSADFKEFSAATVLSAVRRDPLVLVILRTMLGFSPPEFAYVASLTTGKKVDQASARRIDKRARSGKDLFARTDPQTQQEVAALVQTAVQLLCQGPPQVAREMLHRLDKVDTREGIAGIRRLASTGIPYAALLYERFLGRPFASHRDAVSGEVGDILERAVVERLDARHIPFHQAGVAERFEDMDQAPDFLVPDRVRPTIVIEAKLAEDDGTARDKVTRVQHLAEIRDRRQRQGEAAFEVVACVDGRGFGIRREDVKKLLLATRGKLFTLQTVESIVQHTALQNFAQP